MRKLNVFLLLILVSGTVFSQIKVSSTGKVSIGNFTPSTTYNLLTGSASFTDNIFMNGYIGLGTTPTTSYKLDILGITRIKNDSYNNHIIIHNAVNYGSSIYPANDNTCTLGLSNKRWNYVYAVDGSWSSDRRIKENIKSITNASKIVYQLQGVKYDLKKDFVYNDSLLTDTVEIARLDKQRKNKYGLIAQDVQLVIPEIVDYDEATDSYGLEYIQIIPLLLETIKEQNNRIEKLESSIKPKSNQEVVKDAESSIIPDNTLEASLGQNLPNPFSESTTIEYYLPSDTQNATMYIYDMQGKQIKSIPINERENASVVINGYELQPGMYYYSLIADGIIVGTKNMVLTE